MKINKPLDIDLNIISPQKHIRIHEGDVDSVDILIGVTVDDESVDLTGVTIKYDATINNYLAEQDADGSVVGDKISIPVTQNMTAMSGLLLIDVRMIQSDQVLFTQTICATVEKAVVNGSTYIDFDKITIIQRMNALEEKMDYIEELVENFDTSKLIVSVNRPPEGAPAEVDVDLLRVGDTWVQQGVNIVYKLVEAQYNFKPYPSAEPYHKFTWQPLNERYGVGNTEPPTTATYQQIVYTINEVQWSWLPVPEYFKGDHYQMQVGVDDPTYYICKSGTMATTGVCTYTWREEGGGSSSGITIINTETVPESAEWGDSIPASYAGNTGKAGEIAFWEESGDFWGLYNLAKDPWTGIINYNWVQQADEIDIDDLKSDIATKMKLAPLNPTAAQIAAMPSGQLYGDTVNHKGTIKGGQSFYDTVYIDNALRGNQKRIFFERPKGLWQNDSTPPTHDDGMEYENGDLFFYQGILFKFYTVQNIPHFGKLNWYERVGNSHLTLDYRPDRYTPPSRENAEYTNTYYIGDELCVYTRSGGNDFGELKRIFKCVKLFLFGTPGDYYYSYNWEEIPLEIYSKTEINAMIPTVPTNISAFTNDSGYLTLGTLPIYDGTVV